jgi:hypothetical protein
VELQDNSQLVDSLGTDHSNTLAGEDTEPGQYAASKVKERQREGNLAAGCGDTTVLAEAAETAPQEEGVEQIPVGPAANVEDPVQGITRTDIVGTWALEGNTLLGQGILELQEAAEVLAVEGEVNDELDEQMRTENTCDQIGCDHLALNLG